MSSAQRAGGGSGAPGASDVYDELHAIAERMFRGQPVGHTLQPTAVVNEAWVRLQRRDAFRSRGHYVAVAAKAMRHVLVDHARRRATEKRGGNGQRVTLVTQWQGHDEGPSTDVLDLERALEQLEQEEPRQARVAELRFYGGLTIEEIADELGVSHMTVSTDWRKARIRLARELGA